MKPYPWYLFDADGTLFDYETAEQKALAATFQDAGLPFNGETLALYRAINSALWAAFERGTIGQAELHQERFRQLLVALGDRREVAPFAAAYLTNLGSRPDLIPGAEEVVRQLAARRRLFLITNGIPQVQRARLAASPLMPYFAGMVISGDVGYAKPDPGIFDAAFAGMGQPPKEEVLIVGDSLRADIGGGLAYGIDACWYNPEGTAVPDGAAPTYEIRSLEELL